MGRGRFGGAGAEQEQGLGTLCMVWKLGKVAERPGLETPEVERELSQRPCCLHHCSGNQTGVISLKVATGLSSA